MSKQIFKESYYLSLTNERELCWNSKGNIKIVKQISDDVDNGIFNSCSFDEKQFSERQLCQYSVFMSKYTTMLKENDYTEITIANVAHELLDFLFEYYHDDSFSKQEIIMFSILAKELLKTLNMIL